MHIGLLWFDNSAGADFSRVLAQAARRYREKFICTPNCCFVHPVSFPALQLTDEGSVLSVEGSPILVRPRPNILPGHLWVGVDPELDTTAKSAHSA